MIIAVMALLSLAAQANNKVVSDTVYLNSNVEVKVVSDTTFTNGKQRVKYYAVVNNTLLNSTKTTFEKVKLANKLGVKPKFIVINGKKCIVL